MRPFVEEMARLNVSPVSVKKFLSDRDRRFREGNDKIWGHGNWVRCGKCVDSLGYPAYHHRDAHEERLP